MKKAIPSILLMMLLSSAFICTIANGQSFGYELKYGRKKAEIPFDLYSHFIVLKVYVNGTIPLRFILDSGAKHTLILKKEYTDLLGVEYGRKFTLTGADRKTLLDAQLVTNMHLSLKGVQARNQAVLVLDEDYLQFDQFVGSEIHGILGADIFERFVLKIDYKRKLVTLYEPFAFKEPRKKFQAMPLTIEGSKPYLQADVTYRPLESTSAKFLLDCGAGFALLMYHQDEDSLRIDGKVISGNIGMGLGGYLKGYLGRVDRLEINPFHFSNVVTSFQILDSAAATDDASEKDGIIGSEILGRFVYIFHYEKKTLYLKPQKRYNKIFSYDLSGLFILASGPDLKTFVVDQVISNSPAAEADIRPGDVIHKLNGRRTEFITMQELTKKLQSKAGRQIRMVIEREGVLMKKSFRLEQLL